MIDSHAHLDAKQFNKDRAEVVSRAQNAGVRAIINPASDFASNPKILSLAAQFPHFLVPCAGLDPISCLKEEEKVQSAAEFARLSSKQIAAIGEVGLDYYWSKNPSEHEKQKQNLQLFASLAEELRLPLIIHARDALEDIFSLVEYDRVILHCFYGTPQQAAKAAGLGWFVSLSTGILRQQGENSKLINQINLDYLLVETDSPFQSPARERNEPANVALAIRKIAEEKQTSFEKVERATEKNAEKAFGKKWFQT